MKLSIFAFTFLFFFSLAFLGSSHNAICAEQETGQFGCACAGLIACQIAACEFDQDLCFTKFVKGVAGNNCLNGIGLRRCKNKNDILNDPFCRQQKEDYLFYKTNCAARDLC